MPAPAAPRKPTTGGGIVEDLSKLAIPLGLTAAQYGIRAWSKAKKPAGSAAKPASSAARSKSKSSKSTASSKARGRRAMHGGDGSDESAQGQGLQAHEGDHVGASYGQEQEQEQAQVYGQDALTGMPLTQSGGALQRHQQHAMIASEFRRMAAEIGSFLDRSRAAAAKPAGRAGPAKPPAKKSTKPKAKPAAKKPSAAGSKRK